MSKERTLSSIFGAPKISYSEVGELTEAAPEIIVWAAPFMFFCVSLECYFSYKQRKELYGKSETLGSIVWKSNCSV